MVSERIGFRNLRLQRQQRAVITASVTMQDVIEGKDYSFPKQEEQVLQFWDETDAFKQQLKRSEGKKPYVFYDGPPFATGLPHYGHLLAGTLKVCRLIRLYLSPCNCTRRTIAASYMCSARVEHTCYGRDDVYKPCCVTSSC